MFYLNKLTVKQNYRIVNLLFPAFQTGWKEKYKWRRDKNQFSKTNLTDKLRPNNTEFRWVSRHLATCEYNTFMLINTIN